jgi:hypothetical protein
MLALGLGKPKAKLEREKINRQYRKTSTTKANRERVSSDVDAITKC